ncbi:MAG: hypothetical protein JWQ97_3821 [Phenylobacterium sp.]|nr:hypothetical protein [Phenylobacterium sp.]
MVVAALSAVVRDFAEITTAGWLMTAIRLLVFIALAGTAIAIAALCVAVQIATAAGTDKLTPSRLGSGWVWRTDQSGSARQLEYQFGRPAPPGLAPHELEGHGGHPVNSSADTAMS